MANTLMKMANILMEIAITLVE
jgi:hypothetical protein